MSELARQLAEEMDADWVPTIGGRGERHPRGMVGHLFRIKDPATVRVGHCFMAGRLLAGDVVLCVAHSGDCFQTYIPVQVFTNTRRGLPAFSFGSYGIGDADDLGEIPPASRAALEAGEFET